MGTYYHGNSEIQGDGLQTLILMNPGYVNYPDTQQQSPPQNNFIFTPTTNPHSLNPATLPHTPQQFVGIPLSASDFHYNLYNPTEYAPTRELTRSQNGLSLSLSSREVPRQQPGPTVSQREDTSSASGLDSNGVNNGVQIQSVLVSSKYLKAAQELLEEVVNVGSGVKEAVKVDGGSTAVAGDGGGEREMSVKRGTELTTAERQEIQMKKAKLVNMLDEVEQRYRQYHNQMQIVISWFEQAAGIGSAKTYTALALQTISKQFRCLKDAIMGQIRAASKSLGEEDCLAGGKIEGSRLKFVDNQIRQQRALQQLGMIQHNAWRPQRGLPERSVSVLRAWLFEHFLHPYPKDSDKHMLAKQTGLTRSQVSNWFINARVRLWKPMVEEMYMEEIKEQEQNGSEDKKINKNDHTELSQSKPSPPNDKIPPTENFNRTFKPKQDNTSASTISTSPTGQNTRNPPVFSLIGSPELDNFTQGSPKKHRSVEANSEQMSMKYGSERQTRDGFTLMGAPTDFMGGLGSYPIGEIGRFGAEQFGGPYSGNGVSLTLGLPHCESMSISGTHQNFLANQTVHHLGREMGEENEFGAINTPTSSHSSAIYDNMNIQNRKRFVSQLLPDFVA